MFGIVKGSESPRILLTGDDFKYIDEIQVGDELYTFDDDRNLTITTVSAANSHDAQGELYLLYTDHGRYVVTEDHRVYTKRGIRSIQDLRTGDLILQKDEGLSPHMVTKLEKKPEMWSRVFDFTCNPYPSYFVNDMWVRT